MTRPTDIPADIAERAEILCGQYRHIEDDREFVARILMAVGQSPAPKRTGLTAQQSNVLNFVTGFQAERGYSPAYHEIARGVGIASKSGVHRLVHALIDRGALRMIPAGKRSLSTIEAA
jgi:hypothetical protein